MLTEHTPDTAARPPVTLLLGPVGAGKTEYAHDRILALRSRDALAPVWVLLPTERQIFAFRQRLIARARNELVLPGRAGTRALFNIHFFSFYTLYRHLLAEAGTPQRCLDSTARMLILRSIVRGLARAPGVLPHFAPIAETYGFAPIVARLIDELKQNLIVPDEMAAAAEGAGLAGAAELARIYTAYQTLLRDRGLVDRDGEGWLALAQAEAQPHLGAGVALLVADGYDQFNSTQASLLALMAARAGETVITLTTVPGREHTVGRRFSEARRRMIARLSANGTPFAEKPVASTAQADAGRHPSLRDLTARIGLPGKTSQLAGIGVSTARRTLGERDAIVLIEAPDIPAEVGAVLRAVKARLLAGASPDSILIGVRDWAGYSGVLMAAARTYNLPVTFENGERLSANPAVAALMGVLALSAEGFRTRRVLALLHTPYFHVPGIDAAALALLERAAATHHIIAGRAEWMSALEAAEAAAAQPMTAEDEDPADAAVSAASPAAWRRLREALAAFFDCVTPLETASRGDYITWIETLIGEDIGPPASEADTDDAGRPLTDDAGRPLTDDAGRPLTDPDALEHTPVYFSLHITAMARRLAAASAAEPAARTAFSAATADAFAPEALLSRDVAALAALMANLRAWVSADDLMTALTGETLLRDAAAPIGWPEFLAGLRALADDVEGDRRSTGGRDGRVLVTTVAEARGLPHAHVFVVGLSEGVFPARIAEDPLLLDEERDRLEGVLSQQADVRYTERRLRPRAERADEDGLFYELIGQARESLTLSRPTVRNGGPWLASHLWGAVVALLGEARVTRYTAAGVMPAAECATPAEAALVAVHHRTEAAAPPETAALVHWLNSAHPEYWAHIGAALGAETRRASAASAHDAYTGRLASPALVAQAAAMLGPERTWSASQFGELGTCGYRFFARRLVGLEPIEPIEDGADARAVGSVVHGILEAVYRVVQARGLRIAPEHAHEARAIAAEICDRMLADAPDTYHFRAALWADDSAVLRRRILRAVHADFTGTLWSSRSNGLQPPEGPRTVEALEADFHVGLDAGRAGRLRVRGRFDRIDRVNAERPSWLIVDYKTGSRRILPAETRSGRNYQMLVYLWAARQRFGQPDAARLRGEYWHITGDVKAAGKLSFAEEQDVLDDGLAALGEQVARARTGDFSAEANGREDGRCSRHCAYAQLCRASILAPRE